MVPRENHCSFVFYTYHSPPLGVHNLARILVSTPLLTKPCDKLYTRHITREEGDPTPPRRVRKSFAAGQVLKNKEAFSEEGYFSLKDPLAPETCNNMVHSKDRKLFRRAGAWSPW